MADGAPNLTTFPQAWRFLMNTLAFDVHTQAQQANRNARVLRNLMAGRPLWK